MEKEHSGWGCAKSEAKTGEGACQERWHHHESQCCCARKSGRGERGQGRAGTRYDLGRSRIGRGGAMEEGAKPGRSLCRGGGRSAPGTLLAVRVVNSHWEQGKAPRRRQVGTRTKS